MYSVGQVAGRWCSRLHYLSGSYALFSVLSLAFLRKRVIPPFYLNIREFAQWLE